MKKGGEKLPPFFIEQGELERRLRAAVRQRWE
jgi:hypothetical protein